MIDSRTAARLRSHFRAAGSITVLTGAGISAESGIPTFRGPEGYWTVGSQSYHPQKMATHAMFSKDPLAVWQWYCYRRAVCLQADPNPGHRALVEMERQLGERFTLITQNVDGLHLRAGNSPSRTYQIHGNINWMRCSMECSAGIYPVPDFIPTAPVSKTTDTGLLEKLVCPECGSRARPHVLWFDESYDETFYRFESSLRTAQKTDLLVVVGTSGSTTLPNHIVNMVLAQGGLVVDLNITSNLFAELARSHQGIVLQGPSSQTLPEIVKLLPR
ncbi:RNA polymerase subunit sigma [bacterium]|nr:RNA polymerase subunit sigma [bacterium]